MTIRQLVAVVFAFLFCLCGVIMTNAADAAQNVPNAARMTAEEKIGLLKNDLIGPAPQPGELDQRKLVFIGIERCRPVQDDQVRLGFSSIQAFIRSICNENNNQIHERLNGDNKFKFISFDEYFFNDKHNSSSYISLMSDEKDTIIDNINNITRGKTDVVIFTQFLYTTKVPDINAEYVRSGLLSMITNATYYKSQKCTINDITLKNNIYYWFVRNASIEKQSYNTIKIIKKNR